MQLKTIALLVASAIGTVAAAQSSIAFGASTLKEEQASYIQHLGHTPAMMMRFYPQTKDGIVEADVLGFATEVKALGDGVIAVVTIEPDSDPLSAIIANKAGVESVATALDNIHQTTQVSMIVRYAHEMNADWYPWSKTATPAEYRQAFCMLSEALRKTPAGSARKIQMLWAPYLAYDRKMPYADYWPEQEAGCVVDLVGLTVHNKKLDENTPAKPAVERITSTKYGENFYETYSVKANKPFVIAETSAATYETMDPADEQQWKLDWFKELLSPETKAALPKLAGVTWFDESKPATVAGDTQMMNHGIFNRDLPMTPPFWQPFLDYLNGLADPKILFANGDATLQGVLGAVGNNVQGAVGGQAGNEGGNGSEAGGQGGNEGGNGAEAGGEAGNEGGNEGGNGAEAGGEAGNEGGNGAEAGGEAGNEGGNGAEAGGEAGNEGGNGAEAGGQGGNEGGNGAEAGGEGGNEGGNGDGNSDPNAEPPADPATVALCPPPPAVPSYGAPAVPPPVTDAATAGNYGTPTTVDGTQSYGAPAPGSYGDGSVVNGATTATDAYGNPITSPYGTGADNSTLDGGATTGDDLTDTNGAGESAPGSVQLEMGPASGASSMASSIASVLLASLLLATL